MTEKESTDNEETWKERKEGLKRKLGTVERRQRGNVQR